MTKQLLSPTLVALLRYSKGVAGGESAPDWSWQGIANALSPLYFEDMSLVDVMSITVSAYEQALSIPALKMGDPTRAATSLLLAPLTGHDALDWPGPRPESTYTVDQFYNAMLKNIMGNLRIATVDWCADLIRPDAKRPALKIS